MPDKPAGENLLINPRDGAQTRNIPHITMMTLGFL